MKTTSTLFKNLLTFGLLIVTISCYSQEFSGNQKDIDQILQNAQDFSSYVVGANYEMIVESYTEDAKLFPNNMKILEGKEAILNYWKLPEGVQTTYHKLMPSEVKVIGDEAYDYGYYEGKTKRANGEESSWKGKYVVIWRKVEGDWKMYLDIWNAVK
ncbi:YybH family protein [Maribacter sp. 2307UL18-2]|uniref:YybH family protein n=1 Tax=Maribacter sp. 2307UL18-2 TaxID=3386274 RepID=UPI0039BD7B9A